MFIQKATNTKNENSFSFKNPGAFNARPGVENIFNEGQMIHNPGSVKKFNPEDEENPGIGNEYDSQYTILKELYGCHGFTFPKY